MQGTVDSSKRFFKSKSELSFKLGIFSLIFSLLLSGTAIAAASDKAEKASKIAKASKGNSNATANSKSALISRAILFKDPDRTNVQLSPDGKWMSYLAPSNDVLNIWVGIY